MSSTRRRWPRGKVHEMADLGVGTLCGRDVPEPWEWTDDPVDCAACVSALAVLTGEEE